LDIIGFEIKKVSKQDVVVVNIGRYSNCLKWRSMKNGMGSFGIVWWYRYYKKKMFKFKKTNFLFFFFKEYFF